MIFHYTLPLFISLIDDGMINEYIIFPNGIISLVHLTARDIEGNPTMDVTVKSINDCNIVTINGRIDSYTAPQLSETLIQITNQQIFKIILELSEVTYVSSAGLRVLIDIQRKCRRSNLGEVLLVNIPQRVYETLELAGFVPLFKFYNNVTSALAAF